MYVVLCTCSSVCSQQRVLVVVCACSRVCFQQCVVRKFVMLQFPCIMKREFCLHFVGWKLCHVSVLHLAQKCRNSPVCFIRCRYFRDICHKDMLIWVVYRNSENLGVWKTLDGRFITEIQKRIGQAHRITAFYKMKDILCNSVTGSQKRRSCMLRVTLNIYIYISITRSVVPKHFFPWTGYKNTSPS